MSSSEASARAANSREAIGPGAAREGPGQGARRAFGAVAVECRHAIAAPRAAALVEILQQHERGQRVLARRRQRRAIEPIDDRATVAEERAGEGDRSDRAR